MDFIYPTLAVLIVLLICLVGYLMSQPDLKIYWKNVLLCFYHIRTETKWDEKPGHRYLRCRKCHRRLMETTDG